ncbi:hypothetical protein TKV_c06310 [Thermoanaerobacter kivui]|uniref:Uncharacterized protein n=1 Tax=Thermoanaerobacter kivui TaxID=2325 RepID=A0A097APU7_THEKI|nr:hypothetical protein TKV_c06310 [Thermoanaerobacter kivui]
MIEIFEKLLKEGMDITELVSIIKEITDKLGREAIIGYERTYYKSKRDGRYTYLVDDALGIERHERIEKGVKIRLVEKSI